jgi:hypothetical protein
MRQRQRHLGKWRIGTVRWGEGAPTTIGRARREGGGCVRVCCIYIWVVKVELAKKMVSIE